MGGDEFVIVMIKTPEDKAKLVIEKINDLCIQYSENGVYTSISLGVATKTISKQDMLIVYKTAEDKMYDNKLLESKTIKNSIISSLRQNLEEKTSETEEALPKDEEHVAQAGTAFEP